MSLYKEIHKQYQDKKSKKLNAKIDKIFVNYLKKRRPLEYEFYKNKKILEYNFLKALKPIQMDYENKLEPLYKEYIRKIGILEKQLKETKNKG